MNKRTAQRLQLRALGVSSKTHLRQRVMQPYAYRYLHRLMSNVVHAWHEVLHEEIVETLVCVCVCVRACVCVCVHSSVCVCACTHTHTHTHAHTDKHVRGDVGAIGQAARARAGAQSTRRHPHAHSLHAHGAGASEEGMG